MWKWILIAVAAYLLYYEYRKNTTTSSGQTATLVGNGSPSTLPSQSSYLPPTALTNAPAGNPIVSGPFLVSSGFNNGYRNGGASGIATPIIVPGGSLVGSSGFSNGYRNGGASGIATPIVRRGGTYF